MRKLILLLAVFLIFGTSIKAQYIYKIKADSVLITNDSCTAELIIENSTKNVKGFLVNKGNGRTEFRRAQQLTDSSFALAGDTVIIRGTGGGLAGSRIIPFLNYPELRSMNISSDTVVIYLDAKGNQFKYDPSDVTTSDDSAMTIVVGTKRLKRVTYGVLYPRWFGAKGNGVYDDAYPIQKLFNYIVSTTSVRDWKVSFEGLSYNVANTIFLPKILSGSVRIEVDGGGAIISTSNQCAIFSRIPSNDTEAQPLVSNWIGEIHNFTFQGSGLDGQIGLDLGSCYSWDIHHNNFIILDTAIKARFFLQSFIRQNRFTNNKKICVWTKWGDWSGGTIAGDACNGNIIEGNRFYQPYTAAIAAIHMTGGNKNTIRNNISEGNKPVNEFVYDYAGSTNVAINVVDDWYSETVPGTLSENTLFKIRISGIFELNNITSIYKCKLLNLDASNTASILNINKFSYYQIADTPFSAIGASCYGVNIKEGLSSLYTLMDNNGRWSGNSKPSFPIAYAGANQFGNTHWSTGAFDIDRGLTVGLKGGQTVLYNYLVTYSNIYANNYSYFNNSLFMSNGAAIVFQLGGGLNLGSMQAYVNDSSLLFHNTKGSKFVKWDKFGRWNFNGTDNSFSSNVSYTFNGTDAMKIPVGTSLQRPTGSAAYLRFNSDSVYTPEYHDGNNWNVIASRNWVRSAINISGGGTLAVINDVDYTVAAGVNSVVYSNLSSDRTLTLPSASSNTDREITITNSGGGGFDINLDVQVRKNSSTQVQVVADDKWITLKSNGTEWWIKAYR